MCYTDALSQLNEATPELMPFSAEEWEQTPKAVQEFVLSLVVRVQELESEVVVLRERVNRNSRNSSQPPSSDSPEVPRQPRRRAKSGRKRGGQPGHKAEAGDGRLRVGLKSLAEIRAGGSEVHNSFQRVQSGNHGALARQEESDARILAELMLA